LTPRAERTRSNRPAAPHSGQSVAPRKARNLSQEKLAQALETTQGEISKIEHRTDLYLSTLRSYIEAMGGELDIIARFKDGAVRISTFQDINERGLHA